MQQADTELIEQGAPTFEAALSILSQSLKPELAERGVRSIAYHMKSARFPAYKDISGFDFAASEIKEATFWTLHRCEFMDGAQNVVLIGGPGTGTTHVATALGIQAIEHHRRKGPRLLDHRIGQRPRTGKDQGQGRADRGSHDQARPRYPRRVGIPAV